MPTIPDGARVLPPHDWISDEELHGPWALERYLACDVRDDMERPGGLRHVGRVRGYCALMGLARGAVPGGLLRTKAGGDDEDSPRLVELLSLLGAGAQ